MNGNSGKHAAYNTDEDRCSLPLIHINALVGKMGS